MIHKSLFDSTIQECVAVNCHLVSYNNDFFPSCSLLSFFFQLKNWVKDEATAAIEEASAPI